MGTSDAILPSTYGRIARRTGGGLASRDRVDGWTKARAPTWTRGNSRRDLGDLVRPCGPRHGSATDWSLPRDRPGWPGYRNRQTRCADAWRSSSDAATA